MPPFDAVDSFMAATATTWPAGGQPHSSSTATSKRVFRACDYCRKKRLKCTTAQRPCTNCQLYNAECVYTGTKTQTQASQLGAPPKKRARTTAASPPPPTSTVNPHGDNAVPLATGVLEPMAQATCEGSQAVPDNLSYMDHSYTDLTPLDYTYFSKQLGFSDLMDNWNDDTTFSRGIMLNHTQTHAPDNFGTLPPSFGESSASVQQTANRSPGPLQMSTPGSSDGRVAGIELLVAKNSQSTGRTQICPGISIRKDAEDSNFIGLHSTGATIAYCLNDSIKQHPERVRFDPFELLIKAGWHVDASGMQRTTNLTRLAVPEKSFAVESSDSYLRSLHQFYPIVNERSFKETRNRIYSTDTSQLNCYDYSRFFLVVSIGGLSRSNCTESIRHTCNASYEKAWMMIVDVLATPYIDTVEIMLLHVLYHMQLGKGGYAWMLTGIAIRIAEAIGLHRRSPIDLDLGEDQVKRRSQLWWVAYSLDSFNSSTQGRPTAISDLSTDTEAFSVALGDQASEGGKRPSLQLYYWNVTLSQIRNRFCVGLSTYGTMATRLDALSELDSSLLSWRDSIPLDYRPDQENQATGEDYHLVAILHLEYFNLLRSIHWTSLVLVQANKELSATLQHPRIRTSESICLAASRSFIKTLNDIAGHPVQHRIFLLSFLTDHYMAALAVLYRNIFRSPERLSARADLEYFRAGKFHLDRDTNKSELRGDMIDLFDNMLTALEDLLSSHSAEAS